MIDTKALKNEIDRLQSDLVKAFEEVKKLKSDRERLIDEALKLQALARRTDCEYIKATPEQWASRIATISLTKEELEYGRKVADELSKR